MSKYAKHLDANQTPQTERLPGAQGQRQVQNSAGGFSFAVDDWTRLGRFLVLGSEGGTYYAKERELTLENAACVERCVAEDGVRAVNLIAQISEAGRAPKNGPALFALAIAAKKGNDETRRAAYAALPRVARIGTHLFEFAAAVNVLGGWGRGARRAIGRWYADKAPPALCYQLIKYQQRAGWAHRDLLRLAHLNPTTLSPAHRALLHWVVKKERDAQIVDGGLAQLDAMLRLHAEGTDQQTACGLIREYRLPRECVPSELLKTPEIWEALLTHMPATALVRSLGKLSALKLLEPLSQTEREVVGKLSDAAWLQRSRLHPFSILVALRTYLAGHGVKGSLTWKPSQKVGDALDAAFYAAFTNVEPSGKNVMLALDVSGSMSSAAAGLPISCREAACAMSLVTAATEPWTAIYGFGSRFDLLPITPRMRLDAATDAVAHLEFQTTDCSLPMEHAIKEKIEVDAFVVYTDNETYAGKRHPVVALQDYRQRTGRAARLIVVGMAANPFTIADPNDAGSLDVVGLDAAVPALISDFIAGARPDRAATDEAAEVGEAE